MEQQQKAIITITKNQRQRTLERIENHNAQHTRTHKYIIILHEFNASVVETQSHSHRRTQNN